MRFANCLNTEIKMRAALLAICVFALLIQSQNATKIESRIVGHDVATNTPKYTAAILNAAYKVLCTGALIERHFVLTAASCLEANENVLDLYVTFELKQSNIQAAHVFLVAKRYKHESYNPANRANDIALLKLENTVTPDKASLVAIPTTNGPWVGHDVSLRGYGLISPNANPVAGVSQTERNLAVAELSYCQKYTPVTGYNLCTLGSVACLGDQGATLVTSDGTPQLIGIVSENHAMIMDCQDSIIPVTVYTNVVYYRTWIFNTIDKLYNM